MRDRKAGRWSWKFWEMSLEGEDDYEKEIIIYSPDSYSSVFDEHFVVVKFQLEGKDWWLCQFQNREDPDKESVYIRVNNYKDQLREAMTTCYAMNKLMGAC